MSDLQAQLDALRARVARINAKYEHGPPRAENAFLPDSGGFSEENLPPKVAQRYIEEWLTGAEIQTSYGCHFETEKLYEKHRRHGSADIGALSDLAPDLLETISEGIVSNIPPQEWAFLDTETTGLSGGSGTCAFLVGVGRITPEGFHVRQFFMRDYAEEASLLDALTRHLADFRVLITYNGRAFDQPLLETRYRLNRARPPFGRMEHLDLLFGARRLWRLQFESCRLVDLENQVLGVERQGDIPGALIPYIYFEYLRTRTAARMLPVFHHNATDILSLACLAGIVPCAFRDPCGLPLKEGAQMVGVARWLRQTGDHRQALVLLRRAVDAGLRDELMFRTLWDVGSLEAKLGAADAAIAIWTDLAAARNPFRVRALEELAKHYEHAEKNPGMALEMTREALVHEDSPALRRREERLSERLKRLSARAIAGKTSAGKRKTRRAAAAP